MNFIKNKPWKTWRTRKVSFIVVCLVWLATAIFGFSGREFSSEFLEFVYKTGVWILGGGILLVLSDKVEVKVFERLGNRYEE